MKQFSQQFYKKAETTVNLQAAEKRELRERLVAYMEYHPLPVEMKVKAKKTTSVPSPLLTDTFTMVKVPFHAMFRYGAVVAVLVLVVIPFAAEQAVPGDTLYAVKVQFNEELRGTLTFGSFEKVEWETERLNRRIAEARLLASEGRLTEAVEVEVAAAVREHTENAKREIEILRTEDADEAAIASIALDTTLEVQATALKGEADTEVTGQVVDVFAQTSDIIAEAIDESRDPVAEVSSSTLPAYEKLMARVEQNTTRIYELRETLAASVTAEESAEITRRVEDLDRSIEESVVLEGTDVTTAQKYLVEVLQRSQRLIVFLTELEVTKTVDINTLVPVVLTDEEKSVDIASTTAALNVKIEQIAAMVGPLEDAEILEKALSGQTLVLDLSTRMASSTADHEAFVALAAEAGVTADDTIALLKGHYEQAGITLAEPSDGSEVASTTKAVVEEAASTTTAQSAEAASGEQVDDQQ